MQRLIRLLPSVQLPLLCSVLATDRTDVPEHVELATRPPLYRYPAAKADYYADPQFEGKDSGRRAQQTATTLGDLTEARRSALRQELTDQRDSLCERYASVMNGSVLLSHALAGRHLDLAFIRSSVEADWEISFSRVTGEPNGGFLFEVLNAIADAAEFTYTINIYWRHPNLTWTEELLRTAASHDFVLNWWTNTVDLAEHHFLRTFGLLDTSPQLVGLTQSARGSFHWAEAFSWIAPFESRVWYSFIAITLVTGVVYALAESEADESDDLGDGSWVSKFANSVYLSFLTVSGGGGFGPRSWPGKIIAISWAWLILLVVATYTANLASFLVIKAGHRVLYDDLADAIAQEARICMIGGGSSWQIVTLRYPDYPFIASNALSNDLHNGDCDVVVVPKFEATFAERNRTNNPNCNLVQIGNQIAESLGGWMLLENHEKCTELIRPVFQVVFMELNQRSTTMNNIWDATQADATSQRCRDTDGSALPQFKIFSMVGMLLVHGILVFVALGTNAVTPLWRRFASADAPAKAQGIPPDEASDAKESDSGPPAIANAKEVSEVSKAQLMQHLRQALELLEATGKSPTSLGQSPTSLGPSEMHELEIMHEPKMEQIELEKDLGDVKIPGVTTTVAI